VLAEGDHSDLAVAAIGISRGMITALGQLWAAIDEVRE
jgi:hypothetical protein